MQDLMNIRDLMTLDKWLIAYLLFALIDFITGVIKALKTDTIKSRRLREGLFKIVTELLAVVFACILDYILGLNLLMLAMKMILVFKEAVSIVENLGLLGVQMPNIIKDKIEDLNPNKKEGE